MSLMLFMTSVTSSRETKSQQNDMMRILDTHGVQYEQVDISVDKCILGEMREKAGNPSAVPPQLFSGDTYIGHNKNLLTDFLSEMLNVIVLADLYGKKVTSKQKNKVCALCDKSLPKIYEKRICRSCIEKTVTEESSSFLQNLKAIIRDEVQSTVKEQLRHHGLQSSVNPPSTPAQTSDIESEGEPGELPPEEDSDLDSSDEECGRPYVL
ncbi:unnamed protein product [Ranitomeya imitator]|uniref:SH3 domain-binding glutamic acid-rich-like protein 3 n=1 Tax=Ranitomeya imitator TaxID=111125 RepID=A0ABN9KZR5_9NEOB|nr:unnamed protein product [Ranitomeya imitator]